MQFISPSEINSNKTEFYIVDIREKYEYDFSNIQCINIPMDELCDRISELPTNMQVVLMCRSGKRAAALANLLAVDYNMINIAVMEGGIEAWRDEVEKSLMLE